MKTIPSFEFAAGTRFEIVAKHLDSGEVATFFYSNGTGVLEKEGGFVYGEAAPVTRPLSQPFSRDNPLRKSRQVRVLKIQLGLSCNYACDYCSQRFVERPKETSKKDIEEFMAKLDNLEFSQEQGLKIEMWGGEPLVYWKTIKPLVAALKARFKDWKQQPQFSMITNGSILTEEICYWLIKNDFSVAISHDGPGQHVRGPDPFDDPEQKEIILDFYRTMSKQRRISFNSMLTATNMSRLEIQEWFRKVTGDDLVSQGEGTLVDAYDAGGQANSLQTKAQHFAFRKTAFKDVFSTQGQIGFNGIVSKIDGFIASTLAHQPAAVVGQKCGMDDEHVVSIDLRGNVITCQNTSAVETAPNGTMHLAGNIEDMDAVRITSATHWRNRPHCSDCPVVQLCRGSCMYLEGENWAKSCDNAYSDNIAFFALAFVRITEGFVPLYISGGDLPDMRRDIWGDVLEHQEEITRKPFPVKVTVAKAEVEGTAVFTKSQMAPVEGK